MPSVLDELKALDEKRNQLLSSAREALVKKATDAINELNALGYNYRLVEGGASARTPSAPRQPGQRRTGVSDDVVRFVSEHPDGLKRGQVIEGMGAKGDSSYTNSISIALNNLVKSGKLKREDGTYKAA